ncbi:hypothetical protein [Leifsonia shinshuensis]|uniref:hypothetical protein n=1 Tax=Leifsonia TaxID=110932 RepID=UPI00285AA273|nr:hypothetical protein [Leifsonia shinshuensis]MDR6972063.1 hypothetical protein [Leifsonia shinshuensis]
MVEHGKGHPDRLPAGEQAIAQVTVDRLDEDGRHEGRLVLTADRIYFFDDEQGGGSHDDIIDHIRFQGAEVTGDDEIGTLALSWSDQGKVYEGDTLELRAFKDAIDDQLNP